VRFLKSSGDGHSDDGYAGDRSRYDGADDSGSALRESQRSSTQRTDESSDGQARSTTSAAERGSNHTRSS
jgi:hypothetical protein